MEKIFNQKEAAEYAGFDTRTIRRWVKKGYITVENGRYDREQIKKWLYKRQVSKVLNIAQVEEAINEIDAAVAALMNTKLELNRLLGRS